MRVRLSGVQDATTLLRATRQEESVPRDRNAFSRPLDFSLAGKVAVVTGGASGIGAAIVDAYASKGATVVILDRAVQAAQRTVSAGNASAAIGCDVTDVTSVADAINTVTSAFRVDRHLGQQRRRRGPGPGRGPGP